MDSWQRNPATRFFGHVLDSCRDLVFVKNERLEFVYANRATLDLYAPEMRDRILGHTTVEEFDPAEAALFIAQDREAIEAGFAQTIERIVDHRGRTVTLATKKTRFVDDDGRVGLIGVATDISDLVEQTERLTRTNRALERYAALAAHDLAAPLGTVGLMLEMLRMQPGIADDLDAQVAIERIGGVLAAAAGNVSSVLALQKALLTRTLAREPVDLAAVVDRVRAKLAAALDAASARIVAGPLPVVDCHPLLVETLIQNLVETSIKHRSAAAPRIEIGHAVVAGRPQLSIADNGAGVPAGEHGRLFGLFEHGEAAAGPGVGLGLCRQIVEAHGGRIWIERDRADGTRVTLTLAPDPARGDEPDMAVAPAPPRLSDVWSQVSPAH